MAAYSSGADWSVPKDIGGGTEKDGSVDTPEEKEAEVTNDEYQRPTPTQPQHETSPPRDWFTRPKPKTQRRTHYPPRQCRICLDVVLPTFHEEESSFPAAFRSSGSRVTYESPDSGRLLRPCKCKGSQKYVHEGCLSAWRMRDPMQRRNFFECPTCRYQYQLQRLQWGRWIGSTFSQILLTLAIFFVAMFLLGFVADPIINLYIDPVDTIASAGGPTGSLIYEDEPASWAEHFIKGLASLGLLGFAKFFLTLTPWQWFNLRGGYLFGGNGRRAGTGRERLNQLSWIAILVGIFTFLYAVWKGVRAFCRRTLEQAGERVMDVPGDDYDVDDDDYDGNAEGQSGTQDT